MFGPTIAATFDRGDGPIELSLTYPADETAYSQHYTNWFADRDVTRFLLRQYPITLNAELEWMRGMVKDESSVSWALHANGTHIGVISLDAIDRSNRKAELGIMIGDKSYWGKGIATVAEMLVVDFAFNYIVAGGLNKVIARVMVGNEASQGALQRVGFREVGVWKKDHWAHGRWYDVWWCELLRQDWLSVRQQRLSAAGVTSFQICPEGFEQPL